jgi:23S rRNA (guanosine2251-2'-O)-methyltransferase
VADNNKGKSYWIYGQHAVQAALANDARKIERLIASTNAVKELNLAERKLNADTDIRQLDKILPKDAVHQGVAALVHPLPHTTLDDVLESTVLLVLDQVTDPHNVGAILRSAAAFGVGAVIMTEDHGAPENGALAKAACGSLDIVPLIRITNLSSTLDTLKGNDFWCVGLDGKTDKLIGEAKGFKKKALVLGAEGKGLRRLTAEKCDLLVKIPISPQMESLNVSNAAAVALYAIA